MQNNGHLPFPRPGPDCASFADLLPLLGVSELEEQKAARLQTHLAACAYCQAQQAIYDHIDIVLRNAFAMPATFSLSPEDMMTLTNHEEQRSEPPAPAAPAPLKSPPSRHTRRFVSLLSAIAAVLVVIVVVAGIVASRSSLPRVGASAHPGTASATSASTPVAQQTPYALGANDILQAVQMFSPGEGWAVGGAFTENAQHAGIFSALMLHYLDGQWQRVAAPTNAELGLQDAEVLNVSMISPDEGWAVGWGDKPSSASAAGLFLPDLSSAAATSPYSGPGGSLPVGLILHYSAGKWTSVSIIPDAELWSVRMLSPTDGWAAGGGGWGTEQGATTSILLHYDGSTWTPAQVPNVGGITSLVASATEGWATGTDTILHYDGTQWSVFQHLQGVSGLSMGSPMDGWAFGFVNHPNNYTSSYNEVWHYDGSQWVQGSLPSTVNYDTEIIGLCMDSASDGWAVGFGNGNKGEKRYALYLHYTNGQWTQVQGPGADNLTNVFMLSANEGWAVGVGSIMHYLNGSWTVYQP